MTEKHPESEPSEGFQDAYDQATWRLHEKAATLQFVTMSVLKAMGQSMTGLQAAVDEYRGAETDRDKAWERFTTVVRTATEES